MRINTDSLEQPFDINTGARIDLGSTAKLRTLVTYLELIEEAHDALCRHERRQNCVRWTCPTKTGCPRGWSNI